MKHKVKNRMIKGVSLALAATAVTGLLLQTTMSVQAATAMPGIETIIKDNSEDQPFRILELVENSADAEMGYYVSGQEPSVKLYTYQYEDEEGHVQNVHFQNLEEGLSKLPESERKEFAMNVRLKEDGTIDESGSTGIQRINRTAEASDSAPLSYTTYKEKYFLESSDQADDWKKIDLTDMQGKSRTDTVKVNGIYKENKDGTGDYTKEEQQYYPIRNDVDSDKQQTEKYRENIQNFSYIEADNDRAPYYLTFASVDNETINQAFSEDPETASSAEQEIQSAYDYADGQYGYYENVYADLNSEMAEHIIHGQYTFPGENPTVDTSKAIALKADSTQASEEGAAVEPLGDIVDSGTAGKQENPYIYLGRNIDTYPYYQYALVGDLQYVVKAANSEASEESQVKITLEDDQYWYCEYNAENGSWSKTVLSIVTGRQAVSRDDVQKLPDNLGYNYYYRVSQAWFCCRASEDAADDPGACSYYGWYYPNYPSGEENYLPVTVADGWAATHYISAAEYTLTPGTGSYDFVPGGDTEASVQVNQVYYQGGYANNDWLKRYVFYLDPSENAAAFDQFHIEVDTRSASDWTKAVYAPGIDSDSSQTLLEEAGDIDLKDYDLVYINGHLSPETADKIAESQIACIVNADRAIDNLFNTTFAAYLQKDDADDSYVNYQFYFYKNLFAKADTDSSDEQTDSRSLVNKYLKTQFKGTKTAGFEPITKYIEQENQYRALGEKDEEGNSSRLEPLSTELSMARAMEYVINYQYKRNVVSKDKIKVLEIMPDNNSHDYTDLSSKVYEWLGLEDKAPKATFTVCCEQTNDKGNYFGVNNLSDSNTGSYWHSQYNNNANDKLTHPEGKHFITVTFEQPVDVSGFVYTPRQDSGWSGKQNGVLKNWTVQLLDQDGSTIETKSGTTSCSEENRSTQTINFDETAANVKEMKLYFDSALVDGGKNRCASCAELGILYGNVQVTSMTAAEFVGHVDDITSEYDMVYIDGTKNGSSNSFLTGSGELCYSHVGAGEGITSANKPANLLKLLGQLDVEYDQNWVGSGGIRRFSSINTYGENGGGYFRGSGNDMTAQQCEELLDFVKSGYPVIVGTGLLSGTAVNTNKVDNASYYYEFLTKAVNYENVVSADTLAGGTANLAFFANLTKPTIIFAENGKPAEPERLNASGGDYVDGELKYVFTIGNDSDASPALTTYDCKLYLDLNFDGNLSDKEEQEKYIVIQDENGKVVAQVDDGSGNYHYELQAGRQYTLTRKLPSDYFKLITWKMEVSSNQNDYIHASETGYAKQKNSGDPQVINVLQIVPSRCTWTLTTNEKFKQKIAEVNKQGDFQIQVTQTTVSAVNAMKKGEMEELLGRQQMLVIGFADVYDDISDNNGQVQAILTFIRSGKSVLFAHDTTSYINYDYNKMYSKIATSKYNSNAYTQDGDENTDVRYDSYLMNTVKNPTWGLSLNTILRSVVGMDRYGITSDAQLSDGSQISTVIKKGQAISNSVTLKELMEKAGDIAWQTNGGRSTSYAQTQAYSNLVVQGKDGDKALQATKVNEGAITQYPYQMADTISISQTHGQYYQLGLEQDSDINGNSDGKTDVVVWYCLTGSSYSNSPNDARNNYYFYSKGTVIYTGAGHSTVNQDEEIELFINAMVAAANVTAVDPDIDFVDTLSPNADTETTRYYATDQTSWSEDGNNVLEDSMDFYVNVKDYNMVSADLNQADLDNQEMTLEFFIDSDKGAVQEGTPTTSKLQNITEAVDSLTDYDGAVTKVGSDHKFHLEQNNAFKLTLSDPEQYLRTTTGSATSGKKNSYRTDCKLYVKVTSTVYLYGEPKTSTSWASIDLKQRQLFELN